MIYLLRHGDAEHETGEDAERRLTPKGERQSEAAGKALVALGARVDACLSSPKVRAAENSPDRLCRARSEVEIAEELRGGELRPARSRRGRGDILLVGHEPDFSNAVAALTGARAKLKRRLAAVEDANCMAAYAKAAEKSDRGTRLAA